MIWVYLKVASKSTTYISIFSDYLACHFQVTKYTLWQVCKIIFSSYSLATLLKWVPWKSGSVIPLAWSGKVLSEVFFKVLSLFIWLRYDSKSIYPLLTITSTSGTTPGFHQGISDPLTYSVRENLFNSPSDPTFGFIWQQRNLPWPKQNRTKELLDMEVMEKIKWVSDLRN